MQTTVNFCDVKCVYTLLDPANIVRNICHLVLYLKKYLRDISLKCTDSYISGISEVQISHISLWFLNNKTILAEEVSSRRNSDIAND